MRIYTEFIEGSLSNRGNFVEANKVKVIPRHTESYSSMFVYPEASMSFILSNISDKTGKPSAIGYEGDVGIRVIYLDIDMEDSPFDMKVAELKRILSILDTKFGLGMDNLQLYFSGNKGFHIAIPHKVFSENIVFSPRAYEIARMFMCELIDIEYNDDAMRESTVDFKTVHNTAIFRVPLSKHAKSKLYKIPIVNLEEMTEEHIISMAKNCEFPPDFSFIRKDYKKNEELEAIFSSIVERVKSNPAQNLSVSEVTQNGVKKTIFKLPTKGERNHELHRMAYRLFSLNSLKDVEVWDIMRMILDLTNRESFRIGTAEIKEPEFHKLMMSALTKGKSDWVGEKVDIKDAQESVMAGFDFLQNNSRINTFINDLKLLVGCSYAVVGNNMTYKSRVWFRTAIENARSGIPTIYYSGEMSEQQLAMMLLEYEYRIDVEQEFLAGNLSEIVMRDMSMNIGKTFANLKFICKSDITEKELRASIKDCEKLMGKSVKLLIIDSIGSLNYINGNEIGSLIYYAKAFKEIAKDFKSCVISLNHVSGLGSHEDRQPSMFVRGGKKVIDNTDGFFEHSLLIDDAKTNSVKKAYVDNYVYLSYTSKRDKVKLDDIILKMNNCRIESIHTVSTFNDFPIINGVQ